MKTLSPKQLAFIDEYLAGVNATRAAIRAGYSERGAAVQAARLLANPLVQAEIKARQAVLREKSELSRGNALGLLQDMAFADIRDLYDDDGNLKPVKDWPDRLARMVQSVETFEEFEGRGDERRSVGLMRKVKIIDRVRVAELAMRHFGLLNDRLNVNVGGELGERLAKARARIQARRASAAEKPAPAMAAPAPAFVAPAAQDAEPTLEPEPRPDCEPARAQGAPRIELPAALGEGWASAAREPSRGPTWVSRPIEGITEAVGRLHSDFDPFKR